MLINRLRKNLQARQRWRKNQVIDAYRLYHLDMPEAPYIIDIFGDFALVYERGPKLGVDPLKREQNHQIISTFLTQEMGLSPEKIIFKERRSDKHSYQQISQENKLYPVREHHLSFLINPTDYLDCGLFLDHRPLRNFLQSTPQKGSFLNLFCYTGSVGAAAAYGGRQTVNVDLSSRYLQWAQQNFQLNQLKGPHEFIQADILDYLKKEKRRFDTIFLDPPTFSNSKKMTQTLDVQRDHAHLIDLCMKLLAPKGIVYFSTNKERFKLDPHITRAFTCKDVTARSLPFDFKKTKIHQLFEISSLLAKA